jgi:RNA polymerase sigma factor (sigma-70 family)
MDIKNLLCNAISSLEEEKQFEELVRKISYYVKKTLPEWFTDLAYLDDEDIQSEVIVVLLQKREYICNKEKVTITLLTTIVRNHFIDMIRKKKRYVSEEAYISEEAFKGSKDNNNPNQRTIGDLLEEDSSPTIESPDSEAEIIESIFIEEFVDCLKNTLKEREKETLCFKLLEARQENDNPFLSSLSREAKYQAWSRLKKSLRNNRCVEDFTMESVEMAAVFVERFLSEICEKKR